MKFRPCIDIHDGKVKQIVGGALSDEASGKTNFVSEVDASFYAEMYRERDLRGGHIILLNKAGTPEYDADLAEAKLAMDAFPGGLMIGGGIDPDNAPDYLSEGASHVIVTSYIFEDGRISFDKIRNLVSSVGEDKIVLDLSCIWSDGDYHVATNRWQTVSDEIVDEALFDKLGKYCSGFLVHAVDSEGRSSGIDEDLIRMLAASDHEICYAGGISSYNDIRRLIDIGNNKVDFTVGSRLNIFGGSLSIEEIIRCIR